MHSKLAGKAELQGSYSTLQINTNMGIKEREFELGPSDVVYGSSKDPS